MSEEQGISVQEVIQASVEAQDKGVQVNWQQTLFQYNQAAIPEFARLNARIEELENVIAGMDEVSTVNED